MKVCLKRDNVGLTSGPLSWLENKLLKSPPFVHNHTTFVANSEPAWEVRDACTSLLHEMVYLLTAPPPAPFIDSGVDSKGSFGAVIEDMPRPRHDCHRRRWAMAS